MAHAKQFTRHDADKVSGMIRGARTLIIRHNISLTQLARGMNVELEHGRENKVTNVTNDEAILTLKIALAHLVEDNEYYAKLDMIENPRKRKSRTRR